MESVEEMCDHIALINQSNKILDGEINQIRHQFKSGKYFVEIDQTTKDGWSEFNSNFEVETIAETENSLSFNIRKPDDMNSNQLLEKIISLGHITQFRENIPSMNEVFIRAVSSN